MAEDKHHLKLSNAWHEAKTLVWAHRRRLALGLLLMLVSRLAGLVLPASSKYVIDEVIGNRRADLLVPLAMAVGAVSGVCFTIGDVTWSTLIQSHVPGEMLGRVSSLDWMVSFGLVPVSFALAGPVAEALGVTETMIGAGVLSAAVFLAFLLVPGVRDPERWAAEQAAGEA